MGSGTGVSVAVQSLPFLSGMPQVSVGARSANLKPKALNQAKKKQDKKGEDLPSSQIDLEAGARDPPADASQTGGFPAVAGAAGGTSPTPETRYPKSGT